MVTDPPYGVNYDPSWRTSSALKALGRVRSAGKVENDDRADWTPAWRLFPGDVVYVWHGGLHSREVQESLENADYAMRAQIIWAKQHFVIGRGDYHWHHEPCWYAVRKGKKGHYVGDRKQSTIWEIANAGAMGGDRLTDDELTGHGTQKPVECMRRPIINNSVKGDFVYDPFLGSGTTLIAAEMEERRCLGVELNPVYVDAVIRRWEKYTGQEAVLQGSRKTHKMIEAERAKAPKARRRKAA
jgi:DNA modification methylase